MKTTVFVFLISFCSFMSVSRTVNASTEKPRKISCVERVYRSYFFKKSLKEKKRKVFVVKQKTTITQRGLPVN